MTITLERNVRQIPTWMTIIPVDVLNTEIRAYIKFKCKYQGKTVQIAYAGEWFFVYLRTANTLEYDKIIVLIELK